MANNSLGIDQIRRRARIACRVLALKIRSDHEARRGIKVFVEPAVFFEICIFLGDRDDNDIARFKFIVQFLQLTQLLGAERSPMRTISGEDDVRLAQVIIERDSRAVCTWKRKGLGVIADLQPTAVVAPVGV